MSFSTLPTFLTTFISPPFLEPKDAICLIAPSGIVEPENIEQAVNWILDNDFTPKVGIHMTDNYFRFAATDSHRLFDLQNALDNPSIKAIWCVRGGYGMTRILDKLNWDKFIQHPKWLIGFSDITAIQLKINQLGIKSMHGFMPVQFKYVYPKETAFSSTLPNSEINLEIEKQNQLPKLNIQKSIQSLLAALRGEPYQINASFHLNNKLGKTEGEIIGGNLSMLINSLATPTEIDTTNKILFLEEVGENLYAIDRMLGQLFRANKFKNLKGLVIGSFSDSKQTVEQFGFSVEDMILNLVKEYNYPVAFAIPIGHTSQNETVICGENVILEVEETQTRIFFNSKNTKNKFTEIESNL